MVDLGLDKLMLIGVVALVVIGPEKLPRVARTVGAFVGKAQRYVAEVKAEVNRSIELEELQKMKNQFETAARDVHSTVTSSIQDASAEIEKSWAELNSDAGSAGSIDGGSIAPFPTYKPVRKNWRSKRAAVPHWYKQRQGVRTRAQSGAARVARFRPPKIS